MVVNKNSYKIFYFWWCALVRQNYYSKEFVFGGGNVDGTKPNLLKCTRLQCLYEDFGTRGFIHPKNHFQNCTKGSIQNKWELEPKGNFWNFKKWITLVITFKFKPLLFYHNMPNINEKNCGLKKWFYRNIRVEYLTLYSWILGGYSNNRLIQNIKWFFLKTI